MRTIDIAVQGWDRRLLEWADAVAISTPMHTAMRLAVEVGREIQQLKPDLPVASYGLYAAAADSLPEQIFDRAIVGEYEASLVSWLNDGVGAKGVTIHLNHSRYLVPARDLLPPLDQYAHLVTGDQQHLVGAVEASHGCVHMCRHCPIPAIYGGRLRIVDIDTVLSDIDQQVEAGARHITFGDPDFLNGPAHSLRIVRAMHDTHPDLTFDCTVKVEHILRHRELWNEFADLGCVFVVSAFETLNDDVLDLLDKGHTAAEAAIAVHIIRKAGIDIRPSWLPFTPWTTRADLDMIFRFISAHDLIDSTDPVQLGIRLLIPKGSLMLDIPALQPHLGAYEPEALSYSWTAQDPETDGLAAKFAEIAEAGASLRRPVAETFIEQWLALVEDSDLEPPSETIGLGATTGRPKLTESWFC